MRHPRPTKLTISAAITNRGIDVRVNKDHFPIVYPAGVWRAYPARHKELLRDNLTFATTIFLPQMLNLPSADYKTARPLCEAFLFENGMYDMPSSALTDGKSSLGYIKNFFNTRFFFADNNVKTLERLDLRQPKKIKPLILLSMGKESLLSFAVCRELGLEPVLVTVVEPSNTYEYSHKKKLIAAFEQEFGVTVHVVHYAPGLFRYGRYWQLNTELGWGLHLTEYCLLAAPLLYQSGANAIIVGNERSCDAIMWDRDGILTYEAGYDQHTSWVPQQSLLASLLTGRDITVTSLMEPLHEIMEMYLLHSRYPEVGKYQMSCFSDTVYGKKNRWCQRCVKCGYTYALASAFNFDLKKIGFTQNLFDARHRSLFNHFFTFNKHDLQFGSFGELNIAFYRAWKNGLRGESIDRFVSRCLKPFIRQRRGYEREYLGIHEPRNIPELLKTKVLNIYRDQVKKLK